MSQLTLNTTKLEELKAKVQALPAEKKIQESKTVTPSTSSQTVTPDSGYDGLDGVTINAIPDAYQDVTGVDAVAVDVVEGKKIVNSSGETVTGTNPYVKATTDTEVNSQATKLAELKTILEGKASGGGGTVETCSVRIFTQGTGNVGYIFYVGINENGQKELLLHGEDSFDAPFDTTINNVVRGAFVILGSVNFNYDLTACNCTGAEHVTESNNGDLHVIWIHDEAEATIEIAEYSE